MARTVLNTQVGQVGKAQALTWTAFDQANGMAFYNSGTELLLALNTNTAATGVFIVRSVADVYGRTGDLTVTVPQDVALPAAQLVQLVGQFPTPAWNQADGSVNLDYSSGVAADLFLAVLKVL